MDGFGIDESLVRVLVRDRHPDLAGFDLAEVDGGWANRLWRLGDDLAVRVPRTEDAPALLRDEHRWLPVVAPGLPLPVPVPVRIGEPSDRFPRPWTIATWVPGEPADRAPVTRGGHAADRLAGFLRALHRDAPADAPVSSNRGVPLAAVARDFDRMVRNGVGDDVRDVWERAVSRRWCGAREDGRSCAPWGSSASAGPASSASPAAR